MSVFYDRKNEAGSRTLPVPKERKGSQNHKSNGKGVNRKSKDVRKIEKPPKKDREYSLCIKTSAI